MKENITTMKRIVILTGAGVSAESGIRTFRDSDGLWENYRVEDVATYDAWLRDPELVINFYNERYKQVKAAKPNAAHLALKKLEQKYTVDVITQNVDDLHERAGSSRVLHLHGEITKVRSSEYDDLIYPYPEEGLKIGDKCEKGYQLRPHIVWFGEAVPMLVKAANIVEKADIVIIIGTSMVVYPAASLIHYAKRDIPKYYIDPKASNVSGVSNLNIIADKAGTATPKLVDELLENA